MRTSLVLAAASISLFANPAIAEGTCPTQDVVGQYVVKSVSCSDGQEALHSDLKGIRVTLVSNTPEGIDAEIDFLGWNIAWGVYRDSQGGSTETCEDSSDSKLIRRVLDGAVEELRFSASGATLTWPFFGGSTCTWSMVKNGRN